jgi:HSP20 family molecular chaperone IbpA
MPTAKPAVTVKRTVTPEIVDKIEGQKIAGALHQRLSERAYALYEESSRQNGNDEKNWLKAKSEILQSLETRRSGTWVALTAPIPHDSPVSIRVCVDARRVMVQVEKAPSVAGAESPAHDASPSFLAADLNLEVDPSTATAAFKDGTLSVMVKKRSPADTTVRRGS